MKSSIFITALITSLSFSSFANTSIQALGTSNQNDNMIIPITLNNQSNVTITTDSKLIPDTEKSIPTLGASVFNMEIPNGEAIHRVRFGTTYNGCDFYFDVSKVVHGDPEDFQYGVHITAVPVSQSSSCNVYGSYNVNHLGVAFIEQ